MNNSDIKAELLDMKKKVAMRECFAANWFTVCPLSGYYWPKESRQILEEVHCIDFKDMSKEMVDGLKELVREVLYYEEPIKEKRKRWWQK